MKSRYTLGALLVLLLLGFVPWPRPALPQGRPDPKALSGPTRVPQGVWVGDLPVGGQDLDQARAALSRFVEAKFLQPLRLELGEERFFLDPRDAGVAVDVEDVLARVTAGSVGALFPGGIYLPLSPHCDDSSPFAQPRRAVIPLQAAVDEAAVRRLLEGIAARWDVSPLPERVLELTSTEILAVQGIAPAGDEESGLVPVFVAGQPGRRLDLERAVPLVVGALERGEPRVVRLPVEILPAPPRDPWLLSEVLSREAAGMPGVAGVYVQDLRTGQEAGLNEDVVFSGASVVKIAIMLLAYARSDSQLASYVARDLMEMMIYSDNDAANRLLAFAGRGDAVRGAFEMTAMLRMLGLERSFLCSPYGDPGRGWCDADLPAVRMAATADSPRTDPDPDLQTTPREMGLLLEAIYRCAGDSGPLLERFPGQIEPRECQEMLALMEQNADTERLVAGLPPEVEVAHKSGWIPDMKADAGIVFGPTGPYVASIFVWREGALSDEEGNRWIARLSSIVYSFFNPLRTVPVPAEAANAPDNPGG
ncbi:MAG: serine hydrolase [Chloroflexia bacterium]